MRRPLRSDQARAIANLAIDLGDPGRMAKARRIHRSSSVSAIDIESGAAHATVTDSDGELFDVTVSVVAPPAQQLPSASNVLATCTCDDTADACLHALATVLGIAEEVEVNPRMIDRWTGAEAPPAVTEYESPGAGTKAFFAGNWAPAPTVQSLPILPPMQSPELEVDGVDAGPVIEDAAGAIAKGLAHLRR